MKIILDYLKEFSLKTPYKIAFTFFSYKNHIRHEEHITCRQLYEEACRYAEYFNELGIEKGERVVIFAEQRVETIYAIYGTLMVGGMLVLVPTPTDDSKKQRFNVTMKSSEARYIIYYKKWMQEVDNRDALLINSKDIPWKYDEEYKYEQANIDDIACLLYTSGSVSEPKGIMLTHRNIMACMRILQNTYHLNQEDLNISWLPFFHAMGLLFGIFYNTYTNRREIIMDIEVFQEKPMRWLNAISKYRATLIIAPNSAYMTCVKMVEDKDLERLDLSHVKYVINCSEIIQKSNWDAIYDTFKVCGLKKNIFYPMYGLSEAAGSVSMGEGEIKIFEADWERIQKNEIYEPENTSVHSKILCGVGALVEELNVLIVDPINLKVCQEHQVGEVWVQGDSVALGYWNNKEATKEVFGAILPGYEGGFLRTGDLGTVIDNQLYITGRLKEMMVVNGKNIYAKDIEINVKKEIPELQNVLIYAFTMAIKKKERVIIGVEYIGDKEEYEALSYKINKVIFKYFKFEPVDIFFVPPNELPRTDNGKLALMKIYHAYTEKSMKVIYSSRKEANNQPISEFSESQMQIKYIFEKILDVECKSIKDNFLDLGGSSLEIYNLLMHIKDKFKLYIGLEEFILSPTIEGLDQLITKKRQK